MKTIAQRVPRLFRVSIFLSLLLAATASGQGFNPATSIGAPQTTLHGGIYDKVDMQSGNLGLSIPLLHLKGRGLDTDVVFALNSKLWSTSYSVDIYGDVVQDEVYSATNSTSLAESPGFIGLKGAVAADTGPASVCLQYTEADNEPPYCNGGYVATWTLGFEDGSNAFFIGIDNEGNSGTAPITAPPHASYWTTDNSYRRITPAGTVATKDGRQAGVSYLEDANGNTISGTTDSYPSPTEGTTTYTDTLGRTITVNSIDTNLKQRTISYVDDSGTHQNVTVSYTYEHVTLPCLHTNSECEQIASTLAGYGDAGYIYLPSSIAFPGGDVFQLAFGLNPDGTSTGELSKLTLPGGGYVRYTYTDAVPAFVNGTDTNAFIGEFRTISQRFESSTGASADEHVYTYNIQAPDAAYGLASTVIDPVGNVHKEAFTDSFGLPQAPSTTGNTIVQFGSPGISVATVDTDSSGNILRKVENTPTSESTTYSYGNLSQFATVGPTNRRILISKMTLDDAEVSTRSFGFGSYGNVTSEVLTDWGAASPGSVIETTARSYLIDSNAAYDQDTVFHVDLISSSSVSGDCGASTFNVCQKTATTYDGYGTGRLQTSMAATTGVTGHDSGNFSTSFLARGNPTQIVRGNGVNGGSQTVDLAYNDLGDVIARMDGRGSIISYDYTDNFSGPQSSSPTLAFVTTVSKPSTGATTHQEHGQYFLNSGLIAAYCGENFPSSSGCQTNVGGLPGDYFQWTYDPLGRTTLLRRGDGGSTALAYSDSTHILLSDALGYAETHIYDGFGRETASEVTSTSPNIRVETAFDSVGNISAKSNPFFVGTTSPTDGITTYAYDALHRKTFEHEPGDSATTPQTRKWTYAGSKTSRTDERSNTTSLYRNSADLLTEVDEPSGAVTTYRYDALHNLLGVAQKSSQGDIKSRGFSYDSLSQLSFSQNPETGPMCYGVPSASGCSGGYDGNGNLLATTDARGETVNYVYDALNRMTSRIAADGTSYNVFDYDTFAAWGNNNHGAALGRLVHQSSCNAYGCEDEQFAYDVMGRLEHLEAASPSEIGINAHYIHSEYDLAGNETLTYYGHRDNGTYGGIQLARTYDSGERLSSVKLTAKDGVSLSIPYPLLSNVSYLPTGSPASLPYGNGITETDSENNRLQPCRMVVTGQGLTYLDRQYFYGSSNAVGTGCSQPAPQNNGNILHVVDGLGGSYSQDMQYDVLNRLHLWSAPSAAGATRTLNFAADDFGNIVQDAGYSGSFSQVGTPNARSFPSTTWNGSNNAFDSANHLVAGTFGNLPPMVQGCPYPSGYYDQAGNTLVGGAVSDGNSQLYGWDAESRLIQTYSPGNGNCFQLATTNTYDPDGNRVSQKRYDPSGALSVFRDTIRYKGDVLWDESGGPNLPTTYTDYVYAFGRQIARIEGSADGSSTGSMSELRLSGSHPQSGCSSAFIQAGLGGYQYTVQNGDQLAFDENSAGAAGGLLMIPFNASNSLLSEPSTGGVWKHELIDLSSYAGQTVNGFWPWVSDEDAGAWLVRLANISIVSANGNVTPIYIGQPISFSPNDSCNAAEIAVVQGSFPVDAVAPGLAVTYKVADQVGTAQLEFSGNGTPTWRGEFAPFGQELSATTLYGMPLNYTRFRFAGHEHDTDSGLDYFGARFFGSSPGRFISPDFSRKPEPVPYSDLEDPQSLNLYSYARNNPFSQADPDGHWGLDKAKQWVASHPRTQQAVGGAVKVVLGVGLIATIAGGDVPGGAVGVGLVVSGTISAVTSVVSGTTDVVGATTKTEVEPGQKALDSVSNIPALLTTAATGNQEKGAAVGLASDVVQLAAKPTEAAKNLATMADTAKTVVAARNAAVAGDTKNQKAPTPATERKDKQGGIPVSSKDR